jgi:hypothetical protein
MNAKLSEFFLTYNLAGLNVTKTFSFWWSKNRTICRIKLKLGFYFFKADQIILIFNNLRFFWCLTILDSFDF